MVNPFLSKELYDIETAIMLEKANVVDIGNAVAYTDGDKVFLNTPDNLFKILPAYDDGMLKWLLWHERMHMELKHHNRFFKYLSELDEAETLDEFHVTKGEVNIIMDILVHDSLSKMFPELVETAVNNLAQMRYRNSLKYTFTTFTLEEMLDEYAKHKHGEDSEKTEGKGEGEEAEDKKDGEGKSEAPGEEAEDKKDGKGKKAKGEKKGHEESKTHEAGAKNRAEDGAPKITDEQPPEPEHDKTDWSKLEEIDSKEFIDKEESRHLTNKITELKNIKLRLARITETLNGLVTTTKIRSYKSPSHMLTGQRTIFKGQSTGKASLYLCFDASGSMSGEMKTFKEIISKSIPQAMKTPTTWFSGWSYKDKGREILKRCQDPEGRDDDYYKGTFQDFMEISAESGYSDDGDRTIELCFKAEQLGYSPIGVTDGGGKISWSKDMLKQLKRTVLVGQNGDWLRKAQSLNPRIQIISTDPDDKI